MRRKRSFVLLVLLGSMATVPAFTEEPPVEGAQRLSVHGFLNQAFAASDGYQVLGIPDEGTWDYRTAALQLRAAITSKDNFVIQVSQQRLGESPAMATQNEIELDWVFYEHQFSQDLSVRAGKVRLPYGIYNEVRFVGPVLPFFRAPDVFYGEGSYTFDSIDGAVVSTRFFTDHRFSLDADAYVGEWRLLQSDNATIARAKKGLGGQIWLNTPLRGLRLGLGGHRSTWESVVGAPPGAKDTHHKWAASLDGDFGRLRVNAEVERDDFSSGRFEAGYALAALRVKRELTLAALGSYSHLEIVPLGFDADLVRDYAVGLNYAFRPDVLVKVEHHWTRGRTFEDTGLPPLSVSLQARYVIVSLSAVF